MASSATATPSPDIIISTGHDPASVRQGASVLTSSEAKGARRWHVTSDTKGLERVFRFKTFRETWCFMNDVAGACKEAKHHPEWTNIYNKTHIIWTTHNPSGLSAKDIRLAEYCDSVAAVHGEVEPTVEQQEEDKNHFGSKKMERPNCCKSP